MIIDPSRSSFMFNVAGLAGGRTPVTRRIFAVWGGCRKGRGEIDAARMCDRRTPAGVTNA
jgi:truncated hemoglobin YjbI